MADPTFDIEANVDRQEVDNAINQAVQEVLTRYDFKNTDTQVAWEGEDAIRIVSASEDRVDAALDVLQTKLVRRKVSLKAIEIGEHRPVSGGRIALDVKLKTEMPQDIAKEIVKQIKASKIKVTPTNQGDKIRVSGKKRDDLQEVIALVKAQDYDAPLVFTNFR
ncbi:MAG: hypothetical protein ACI867_001153 [Glaciecola sp.]|jgi:uncharacterized protein YajQ (UPF0234 family)